jgi:hypothetical protein
LRAAGFLLHGLEFLEEFDPPDVVFLAAFQAAAGGAFVA